MNNPVNQIPQQSLELDDSDDIDLLEIFDILLSKWKWIAFGILVPSLITAVVVLLMPPIYRAETLIVINMEKGSGGSNLRQFSGLAELAGVNIGSNVDSAAEAIATLKSQTLINEMIKEKNLMQVLFSDAWDTQAKKWLKEAPTKNEAYESMKKIVNVNQDKKTGLITLTVDWQDRFVAAELANDIVARANKYLRERDVKDVKASIEFLNQELSKSSSVEIQQAIFRLIESNYKTASIVNAKEQYAFKVIDPAIPADIDKKIKPKRALSVMLAAVAGGFLALVVIFLQRAFANLKLQRSQRKEI